MALIPVEGMLPCGELGNEEMGNDDGRRYFTLVLSLCVDKKRTVLGPNTVCRETATGGLMDCSIICLCLEINKGPSNH